MSHFFWYPNLSEMEGSWKPGFLRVIAVSAMHDGLDLTYVEWLVMVLGAG